MILDVKYYTREIISFWKSAVLETPRPQDKLCYKYYKDFNQSDLPQIFETIKNDVQEIIQLTKN